MLGSVQHNFARNVARCCMVIRFAQPRSPDLIGIRESCPVKLIPWYVARSVVCCEEQLLALSNFHPDILALQEVLPKSAAKPSALAAGDGPQLHS